MNSNACASYNKRGIPTINTILCMSTDAELEQEESKWLADNKTGQIDKLNEYTWILWNYDIGKTQLKKEHKDCIGGIMAEYQSVHDNIDTDAKIIILGFASLTGGEIINLEIAHDRAIMARKHLLENFNHTLNEKTIAVRSYGYNYPWNPEVFNLNKGELLAQNRRIYVEIFFTPRNVPINPSNLDEPEELDNDKFKEGDFKFGTAYKFAYKITGRKQKLRYVAYQVEVEISAVLEVKQPGANAQVVLTDEKKLALKSKLTDKMNFIANANSIALSQKWFKDDSAGFAMDGSILWKPDFDPSGPTMKIKLKHTLSECSPFILQIDNIEFEVAGKIAWSVVVYAKATDEFKSKLLIQAKSLLSGGVAIGAGAILGGIAGTVGIICLSSQLIKKAREDGQNNGLIMSKAYGYALRISAAICGGNNYHNISIRFIEDLIDEEIDEEISIYESAYDGWYKADGIVNNELATLTDDDRTIIITKYGNNFYTIYQNIINAIVGNRDDGDTWSDSDIPGTFNALIQLTYPPLP